MAEIEITKFKSSDEKKLYRLTSNEKDIYIKLENVNFPFNYQKYNNNYYINAEVELEQSNKLHLIKLFESIVKNKIKHEFNDENFISIIKPRERSYHIKLMLKKQKNKILIDIETNNENDNEFSFDDLPKYHKLNTIYDIIIKPEILWSISNNVGITFYLSKIIVKN
jgi:hypothetical protein